MGSLITALLILASLYDIERTLPHLPARIPTHFTISGQVTQWGPASTLWFLFAMQVAISGFILLGPLLARWIPAAVHFGRKRLSDMDPEQRKRVLPMFAHLMIYLSIVIAFGFYLLIHESMEAAVEPQHRIPVGWLLGIFLGAPVALLLYYLPRINRVANEPLAAGRG